MTKAVSELETISFNNGYGITRDDGQLFQLVFGERGNAVLYHVEQFNKLPLRGLVDFDISIEEKLKAAKRWATYYPESPPLCEA